MVEHLREDLRVDVEVVHKSLNLGIWPTAHRVRHWSLWLLHCLWLLGKTRRHTGRYIHIGSLPAVDAYVEWTGCIRLVELAQGWLPTTVLKGTRLLRLGLNLGATALYPTPEQLVHLLVRHCLYSIPNLGLHRVEKLLTKHLMHLRR